MRHRTNPISTKNTPTGTLLSQFKLPHLPLHWVRNTGCQHTKMRNMFIKNIIWQVCWLSKPYKRDHAVPTKLPTLTKAAQIKLLEQGLVDLINTANKTLPFWLLQKLTARASFKASCHAQLLGVTIRVIWWVSFSVEVILPNLARSMEKPVYWR